MFNKFIKSPLSFFYALCFGLNFVITQTSSAETLSVKHGTLPNFPIVYVRCLRTAEPLVINGEITVQNNRQAVHKNLQHADIYDVLPDVSHFYQGFNAPCDLVLRTPNKQERILYNCSSQSTSENACAALDPAVSFDGNTIAFSVFRGHLKHRTRLFQARDVSTNADQPTERIGRLELPNQILKANEAQIFIFDLKNNELTALPHIIGTFDSGPAWLSNGRLAFTSDRGNTFMTAVPGSSPAAPGPKVSRIYTMDSDGRNIEVASYHALSGEQHPLQLRDGRLAYSSWQLFGALPFRYTNGSPGRFGTLSNFFHLYVQNPDGSHPFALYGQHLQHGGPITHNAAHFLTQSSDARIWVTDYYRANNNGLGAIVGFDIPPEGQEGFGPEDKKRIGELYRPRNFYLLTNWAKNDDVFARVMPSPEYIHPEYNDPIQYVGKLGHPSSAPDNGLLVTWGKGGCSTVTHSPIDPMAVLTRLGLDSPACDTGIYFFSSIPDQPSQHPSDMQMLVDSRQWHEFMAKAVVPYQTIHGINKPKIIADAQHRETSHPSLPNGSPFGLLSASSMLLRETLPINDLPFEGEQQWGLQGTDTIDYHDEELCGLRILGVQPNTRKEHNRLASLAGERLLILGEIPVRNYTNDGTPIYDPLGMHDTSFRVRFPAQMPYLMQAIDCQGRTLNSDQTWQHLRPMEQKTCGGCHVHGKEGLDFTLTEASHSDYLPYRLGVGWVPLLIGKLQEAPQPNIKLIDGFGYQLEFQRDIMPIFKRHCHECHSGEQAAAGLRLDIPGIDTGSTWHCLTEDKWQRCVPEALRHNGSGRNGILRRPQVSKYMRFMNSRGSLLYWKAANQRTDNRTDNQFGSQDGDWHDIDFGTSHPTDITASELGVLSRWIDLGAPAGNDSLTDTIPPTVTVMLANKQTNQRLVIGTVDVPSGIDTDSLTICMQYPQQPSCAIKLTPQAHPSDRIEVNLSSPLTDPDTLIRVSVADRAGNITTLELTFQRLKEITP